ncbi:hypothetical protein HYH03_011071 [Edaphochlamys debaryana]|uniref:Altered inheritance of mitochondria protein 24, mitochondrial n=1 Tax=Edaphochlamys debaryana TaxID=47281 RepID=A0A836BVG7_9CHLO|nr:hypothetical protein HYH03_011071 [Edaphochlamys debaryana]|eukprot:KAG2490435.1 hypothetical protein HYH03_011071 [Edaphochlamys debaryana]
MAYMDGALKMTTNMGAAGKALGRWFSGEDLFLNHYEGTGPAQLLVLSMPYPGDIVKLDLAPGESWKTSRGALIAATPDTVDVSGSFNARGLLDFGQGEGAVLTKVTAPPNAAATLWLASYGHIQRHVVPTGRSLLVDNESFLACPLDVGYTVDKVGGFKSLIFGGEGLVMRFQGPCILYTQSKGLQGLASALSQFLPAWGK